MNNVATVILTLILWVFFMLFVIKMNDFLYLRKKSVVLKNGKKGIIALDRVQVIIEPQWNSCNGIIVINGTIVQFLSGEQCISHVSWSVDADKPTVYDGNIISQTGFDGRYKYLLEFDYEIYMPEKQIKVSIRRLNRVD
jgi:hypothetical protein